MDTGYTIIAVQEKNMKVTGRTVTSMVKVHIVTPLGMYILDHGWQEKKVDKEFLNIKMELFTRASGRMTKLLEKQLYNMQMVTSSKETM